MFPDDKEIQLLCDGTEAFPEILSCIRNAEKSIFINMFIWRNDEIGKAIARELITAANRGVSITIQKDRYGISLEYCEEDQTSLFHPVPTAYEAATIKTLELLYNPDLFGKEHTGIIEPLAAQLLSHPNVTVNCETVRKDHSKFYIFDDEILIFGGINIEDKENGSDRQGRAYRDFMVKISGRKWVDSFYNYRKGIETPALFKGNQKQPVTFFHVKDVYLDLINQAKKELTILMAYFSPMPEFMTVLERAMDRGVHIRILIPAKANFDDDTNKRTLSILYTYAKENRRQLALFLSPDMTHTKFLMSESTISLGSCNITRNAFDTLDEMNVVYPNGNTEFAKRANAHADEIIASAKRVTSLKDLSYSRVRALMERTVM